MFRRLVAEVEADGYCCDGRLRIDAAHPVHCLVRGDDLVPAISAASIVAKVHRDALMRRLHLEAPVYDWASNKGYGAPAHRAAILAHGVHPEHRRVFIDNLLQLELASTSAGTRCEACPPADLRLSCRGPETALSPLRSRRRRRSTRPRRRARGGRPTGFPAHQHPHPADQGHAGPALAAGADGGQLTLGHRPHHLVHRGAVVAAVLVEGHVLRVRRAGI